MHTHTPMTAKEAAQLEQGLLSFSVAAPFRRMLRPEDAAAALCLVWKDRDGRERRFNTRTITELMDQGKIEGLQDDTKGTYAFRMVSRASLMLYCARHWTMPADEMERALLDYALDLPVDAMKRVAAALAIAAEKKSERLADGTAKLKGGLK